MHVEVAPCDLLTDLIDGFLSTLAGRYDDAPRIPFPREHPELHFTVQNDQITIRGSISIKDGDSELDRFLIEIVLPNDYPASLPIVREVGGRIPKTLDRHVILSTGDACVLLPEERWRLWPRGSSLLAFIDGPLCNYFMGQSLVEHGEPWPFGEWAHGFQGVLDYYKATFGTDEAPKIRKYLDYLAAKKVKGHWDCPCESGKRLRECHMAFVTDLRTKISRADAARFVDRLKLLLQMQNKH